MERKNKKETKVQTPKVKPIEKVKEVEKVLIPKVQETPVEVKPVPAKWQKIGGGAFHMNKRIIKPNETFFAFEEDIPKAFRNLCIKLSDGIPKKVVPPTIAPVKSKGKIPTYSKQLIEEGDEELYNIVNEKGKVINEAPLSKEDAEQLIIDLEA